ncbi:hypothetical protein L484_006155 [Morus notabilis]|uniref:AB hydrolase-1 domain-containing protein n=1 Tax=Morus notabilis TaxID=981085 RepID=W9SA88_9ROSA|nr:hypothetical protein L484_006155 [Morus notabilis]
MKNKYKHETRPAVVFLHGTGQCKESLRHLLESYASRGYVSIAVDSRYHGERGHNSSTYQDALISSWKRGDTMPFIFDTVCMHGLLLLLTRYSVAVPIIGVQGFRWAVDNDKWQARVDSIKPVFGDLGKSVIDKEVVRKVWDRIAPGLASHFDSPYTVPAIAPRPLLILNGAEDPRCPLPGLEFVAEPGIGHQLTSLMVKEASDWFDKFLI